MKRIVIAAVAVTAITGCTIERTVVEQAATTTEAPSRSTAPADLPDYYEPDESGFLAFIEQESGPILVPAADLFETGYMVCDLAAQGATAQDFSELIWDSVSDEEGYNFLATVTAAALGFLCPEQGAKF